MMRRSRSDDEKIHANKGIPPKRNDYQFVNLFIAVGIVAAVFVLFGDTVLQSINERIFSESSAFTISTGISATILSLMIGTLQAWLFRFDMQPENVAQFVLSSALGGLLGGVIAGLLRDNHIIESGLFVGTVTGIVGGASSSLIQNRMMRSEEAKAQWFYFSSISWAIVWGVGWSIAYSIPSTLGTALTTAVILIFSGLALVYMKKFARFEF
jgi:hypothetical protein